MMINMALSAILYTMFYKLKKNCIFTGMKKNKMNNRYYKVIIIKIKI